MRNRTFRAIVTTLSVALISSTPVHAVPVVMREVLQVFSGLQNPPELRLRSVSQNSMPLASWVKGPLTTHGSNEFPGTLTDTTPARGAIGSLLSGITTIPHDQQLRLDIIDQGDVQGTICDCGKIFISSGGFPKWPLLFLAAVPLFFIDHGDHGDTPALTPTPTPTVVPTPITPGVPVPEPPSLLLLGAGLLILASDLRRRLKAKSVGDNENHAGGVNRC